MATAGGPRREGKQSPGLEEGRTRAGMQRSGRRAGEDSDGFGTPQERFEPAGQDFEGPFSTGQKQRRDQGSDRGRRTSTSPALRCEQERPRLVSRGPQVSVRGWRDQRGLPAAQSGPLAVFLSTVRLAPSGATVAGANQSGQNRKRQTEPGQCGYRDHGHTPKAAKTATAGNWPPPARCPPAARPSTTETMSPVRNSRNDARGIIGVPFRWGASSRTALSSTHRPVI